MLLTHDILHNRKTRQVILLEHKEKTGFISTVTVTGDLLIWHLVDKYQSYAPSQQLFKSSITGSLVDTFCYEEAVGIILQSHGLVYFINSATV